MMRRRDIEARLALYDELTGILGAMKSFALVELRRLTKREAAEHRGMETLEEALKDMAPALPPTPKTMGDIWLLFGSSRGFCGSFNEDVHQVWQDNGGAESPSIVIGERLSLLLPETVPWIAGATGTQDAPDTIMQLLNAMTKLRQQQPGEMGLVACLRAESVKP